MLIGKKKQKENKLIHLKYSVSTYYSFYKNL